jgi:predicted nucleic acid-binding protein
MSKVFLDANILYSNTLRSLFIWLHKGQVIKVFWSMEVWEEAFNAFSRSHDADMSNKFRSSMLKNAITVYTECMVRVYDFTPIQLKDPNDEHVLSAAMVQVFF